MHVVIAGGGISGLSSAFYLKQARPDWEITILDAGAELGGTMRTETVEGFHFEMGSNGFLTNKPDTLDLVRESGAEHLLLPSNDNARIRYIYTDTLHRLPESPPAFLATRLLSLTGKLRTLAEILIPARREESDETLQSFGYRRVGREFTDVFLNAMTAGIYGSTPEVLSVKAAFPLVVALEREYGGLFRGMLKKRRKQAGPGGILMSFNRGVSTFVEHLAAHLDADIRTNTPARAVSADADGYRVQTDGESFAADAVVLATPAYVAAQLLQGLDAEIAERLATIEYSPISVVGLGYRDLDHPLPGFGLLTTASANLPVLGVLWDSSIFPDRAPAGCKSLRVMIGGQRNPELALQDEAGLIATARAGVEQTMGIDAEPLVTFSKRWDRGIPNYRVGHIANVDALFAALPQHKGLYLNANAYRGVALNDCVRNSRELAQRITAAFS
jgi:oxygen-dependent protoporphyrinogen oxidase